MPESKKETEMRVRYHLRKEQRRAFVKAIESWKAAYDQAQQAFDVQDMVQEAVDERAQDEQFLRWVLQQAAGEDRVQLDEAHQFIQDYCELGIHIHDLIREAIVFVRQLG